MKLEKVCPSRTFFTCAYAWRNRGVVAFEPNMSSSRKNRTFEELTGMRKSRFMRVGRTETVVLLTEDTLGIGNEEGMKLSVFPGGFRSYIKSVLKSPPIRSRVWV